MVFSLRGNLRRLRLAALVEHLARHHLEQVAALEALHRLATSSAYSPGSWSPRGGMRSAVLNGSTISSRGRPFGRKPVAGIVVAVGPGLGRIVVDDQDLVGQEQHEVALALLALEPVVDRIELEGEIVAEGAVEAEIGVFLGLEQRGDGAQHREHGRNAAALLFGEDAAGLGDLEADELFRRLGDRDFGQAGKRPADRPAAAPRRGALSASMRMARPRAEITSGGSMMAVSQRV